MLISATWIGSIPLPGLIFPPPFLGLLSYTKAIVSVSIFLYIPTSFWLFLTLSGLGPLLFADLPSGCRTRLRSRALRLLGFRTIQDICFLSSPPPVLCFFNTCMFIIKSGKMTWKILNSWVLKKTSFLNRPSMRSSNFLESFFSPDFALSLFGVPRAQLSAFPGLQKNKMI